MSLLEFQPWLLKEKKTQTKNKSTLEQFVYWRFTSFSSWPTPFSELFWWMHCIVQSDLFSTAVLIPSISHGNLCTLNDAHWSKGLCLAFLSATLLSFTITVLGSFFTVHNPALCRITPKTIDTVAEFPLMRRYLSSFGLKWIKSCELGHLVWLCQWQMSSFSPLLVKKINHLKENNGSATPTLTKPTSDMCCLLVYNLPIVCFLRHQ